MASSFVEPPTIQSWTYEVQDWGHDDEVAWAVLEHTAHFQEDRRTLSNQLRTYRLADGRWYLTSAIDALPARALSTEHFEIHYREPDREILKDIAPSLDSFYEGVARDLGLEAREGERLTVEVAYSFDLPPTAGGRLSRLLIHSPLLVGDVDTFQLNLAASVVRSLLGRRAGGAGRVSNPLLHGLVAWEALHWPENARWEAKKTEVMREALQRGVLPPLPGSPSTFDPYAIEVRYYANVTILEYIAKTYGRDSFADVVEAAQEYDDLRDVIPAAVGVDLEEFEAGWHAYLESEYGGSGGE